MRLGFERKRVSERLGHSSIQITMDLYGHLMPNIQDDAICKLEDMLGNIDDIFGNIPNDIFEDLPNVA